MTFKKWQKPPKKWEKLQEVEVKAPVIEEETPVSTVIENEISEVEEPKVEKSSDNIIWNVWNTVVAKPKGRIAFEAQVAPVPLFKLPADIRQYLINNGFSSDVYKKDKERLEKHNADMEMINRLKDFLTHL